MAAVINREFECTPFIIWDDKRFQESCDELTIVNHNLRSDLKQTKENNETTSNFLMTTEPAVSTKHSCSVCKLNFPDYQAQTAHFKSDLHRINLKRQIDGKEPLKPDDIEDLDSEDSEISSSSESEPELESIELPTREPKIILENGAGLRFSIYKCLLLARRETPPESQCIVSRVKQLPTFIYWAVILLSAGHFAAAIFEKNKVMEHKTFHRYVTRRKQGTSQSNHDQHHSHAKSAGASLRRHHELALTEDITRLIQSWQPLLSKCSHVFYRACGSSRRILFSGKKPILPKGDTRFRRIPFATKRPTHDEVIRTHTTLSTVEYLGFPKEQPEQKIAVITTPRTARKKQIPTDSQKKDLMETLPHDGGLPEASGPVHKKKEKSRCQKNPSPDALVDSTTSESGESILELEETVQMTSDLKLYEVKSPRKPTENNPQDPIKTTPSELLPFSQCDDLYTSCKMNNVEMTKKIISSMPNKEQNLNMTLGQINTTTFLHIASKGGFQELLWLLLEHGADPTVKDGKGQLPYTVASNKETRNKFRQFAAKYPNHYNYGDAQIPSPLSEEEEKAKALRKQKQRQEKRIRSKENRIMQEEKTRFLGLTDYEKKAWCGQRGLKMRCFQCGELIPKIPFEYNGIQCCSVNCILEHRKKK